MPVHLSCHGHTLYGVHGVLSSVSEHTESTRQAAVVRNATVGDLILSTTVYNGLSPKT